MNDWQNPYFVHESKSCRKKLLVLLYFRCNRTRSIGLKLTIYTMWTNMKMTEVTRSLLEVPAAWSTKLKQAVHCSEYSKRVLELQRRMLWRKAAENFTKSGQPGWGSLNPTYNVYLIIKLLTVLWWFLLLLFIPLVNIIVVLVVTHDLAKSFGKGLGWG